jgi:hypothetical protein
MNHKTIKVDKIMHESSSKSLKDIIDNPLIADKYKNAAAYEYGWRMSLIENGAEQNVPEDQK